MREEVKVFAEKMSTTLDKRGEHQARWVTYDIPTIMDNFSESNERVGQAVLTFMSMLTIKGMPESALGTQREIVIQECAAAANKLMMLADNIKNIPDIKK